MTEIKSNYMIDFKPIRIEDKELITTYFLACGNRDCNLSFVNLYTWQFLTNSHYAVVDDCLVVRFTLDEESVVYTMPVGTGDVKNVIELLKQQDRRTRFTCTWSFSGVGGMVQPGVPGKF